MTLTAGVLAVQGDVSEHAHAIERAARNHGRSVAVREIRSRGVLPECDLLLVPGGESTTISRLVHDEGIDTEIHSHVEHDKPVLATCAGLIVFGRATGRVETLGVLDVDVERNAFGRQHDSFETALDVTGLDEPFPAAFIRAPAITNPGNCAVLARVAGRPVAVRQGPIVATAFHPELTDDARIHRLAFFDGPAGTQ
ncbi:pyridoxal 5'-phosphate synthase glutaminase subunit PdxT [Halalkalicoccus jeotgali]|uniref:Pyridoxal 5'-phosphate synthase subunit PdxT n=1 Tax=Halalkalicoccus jeotgali (strain DSM 18796 / CECT 7217 / JCM 14584 / KCTC 4019 / B3) TaxID=795797 RepID=D8J7N5_HALJB|nr:pyridoxal 5'-phosphate synthase glutaminase subunit PdxT [Halalkalicoccus jeotgali]ADJ16055.1 glutamine amidotransferase subunit PdxT [Halalkalicoccus jeotgali B3]ELY38151.1 glutamine amidotransferase subunit PdxT [Halalkalicoccus jeotgali B3]